MQNDYKRTQNKPGKVPHEECIAPVGEEPALAELLDTPEVQPDTPVGQPDTLEGQPDTHEEQHWRVPEEEQHWGVPEEVHHTVAQPAGAGYPVPQGAVLDVDHPGT